MVDDPLFTVKQTKPLSRECSAFLPAGRKLVVLDVREVGRGDGVLLYPVYH